MFSQQGLSSNSICSCYTSRDDLGPTSSQSVTYGTVVCWVWTIATRFWFPGSPNSMHSLQHLLWRPACLSQLHPHVMVVALSADGRWRSLVGKRHPGGWCRWWTNDTLVVHADGKRPSASSIGLIILLMYIMALTTGPFPFSLSSSSWIFSSKSYN